MQPKPPDDDAIREMRRRCREVMELRIRALTASMRPYLSDLVQDMLIEQFEAICRQIPFPGEENSDWKAEE